jgi:hypothetical protein
MAVFIRNRQLQLFNTHHSTNPLLFLQLISAYLSLQAPSSRGSVEMVELTTWLNFEIA